MTPEQIAESIGADSVRFLSVELLRESVDDPHGYCYSCFTGRYPIDVPLLPEELRRFERDSTSEAGAVDETK
jgi:amidophosphoribosyltransferase